MLNTLLYMARVLYCSVVIIVCGSYLKMWYDMNSWRIKSSITNIRSKIGF